MEKFYDAVVVGGGPAGLTAAIYLARARYRVVVVEKEKFGGQITITSEVVNYPGIARTSGTELTETMRKQAQSFGAELLLADVEGIECSGEIRTVRTSRGDLECFGILLATGAHPRMIGFRGEEEFRGHGVAYCATCDGEFFTGMDVFVVGGGFAAAEESVFLTKYARHVTILIREEDFTCAKSVADAARSNEKITVLTDTQVEEVAGDSALRLLRYRNDVTGEVTEYRPPEGGTFGVFVFAGYEPATSLFRDVVDLDPYGYIVTDGARRTSVPGVYAAGDVCVKNLRQVVTAVGDGALAATELERYAASMQEKTGLRPIPPVTRLPQNTDAPGTDHGSSGKTDGDGTFITGEMKAQLDQVFAKMARPLLLKLYLDETPASEELSRYMAELAGLTDKLSVEIGREEAGAAGAENVESQSAGAGKAGPGGMDTGGFEAPCVRVCLADGTWTGLAFHGVPGGHEFTSFVLGLYNAAGPGQDLEPEVLQGVRALEKQIRFQVLVSLSCTMCPELVTAAQRIAAENPQVAAEVYDLNHFPELKKKYQVMSVPCLVINGEQVSFGKKNIRQLLEMVQYLPK